jgi:poly(3-hydroxybutyrate) depolymerase
MTAKLRCCLITSNLLVLALTTACARPLRQASEPPPTAAATSLAPGDTVETLVSSVQTRHYRLHVPPGYQPGRA